MREQAPRTSVINETMARRYFPDRSPLGRIIQNPHGKSEVVGVVADVHNQGLDSEPRKQVYLPLQQSPTAGMALVARTERDPHGVRQRDPARDLGSRSGAADLRAEHDGSDPGARGVPAAAEHDAAGDCLRVAALLLAALGIYGVLSYSVSQRTREIGLRMALGASGGNTVAMIVRNSVVMVAIGGVIGLVAATLLARSMAGILYGVGPFDLPSFALAALAADRGRPRGEPAAGAAHDARRSDGGAAGAVTTSGLSALADSPE